ncbi:MAG TPA: glycosyl hydrolase family 18 protein [Lachnospiraceae bacterium]|nr:glycosyl hydrolase family 18 protein [Lachnospiraceae bacterium]
MIIYTVQQGDTVDMIATNFGVPASTIIFYNQLPYPYRLAIGQALLLSVDTDSPDKRSIYTGGYAYPFISNWVLSQTLPYLSYLYVFSYGFTADGNLLPPQLDDTFMITMAKQYGSSPILTLTPFDETGNFNNYLISQVVNNPEARTQLKDEIVYTINSKGFEGLDIDFEFILAADRDAFVDFVAYMQESISALGYPVSVALAPKTSDTQVGLVYEGKDYKRLGAAADYVLLMTYEWGYTYGPPMAVAPLNKVREVVEYAITVIPAKKIHLGIANYGYDWKLPFVRGQSEAVSISNVEAVQIAIRNNVPILFDETAMSPFINYQVYSQETGETEYHQVWFEDVRSYNAKMDLIEEYQLRGFTCWQIMNLFRGLWLVAADRFNII